MNKPNQIYNYNFKKGQVINMKNIDYLTVFIGNYIDKIDEDKWIFTQDVKVTVSIDAKDN